MIARWLCISYHHTVLDCLLALTGNERCPRQERSKGNEGQAWTSSKTLSLHNTSKPMKKRLISLTAIHNNILRCIWRFSGSESCFTAWKFLSSSWSYLFLRENQVRQANTSLHKGGHQNMSQDRVKDPEQEPVQDLSWTMYRGLNKHPVSWREGKDNKKLVQAFFSYAFYLHNILILLSIKAD